MDAKDIPPKKIKMFKNKFKKIILNSIIIIFIFSLDRISKIYILKIAEIESSVDIYLTPYLNSPKYLSPFVVYELPLPTIASF